MPGMTPEQRIRMIMGLNGTPVPDTRPKGTQALGRDPFMSQPPEVSVPPMYDAGMVYKGDAEPVGPIFQPGDWHQGVTFDPPKPPSNRDRIAAAHQKRLAQQRAMQGR